MTENAKGIQLGDSLSSGVMEPDLTREDLKSFLLKQAPNSLVLMNGNLEMQFFLCS